MKQKTEDLSNLTWISRFWALYNKLPETQKESFYLFALSIVNEVKNEDTGKIVKKQERL